VNFLIYRDGDVFVCLQIPELHHAFSLPRQMAPAAGLFGILFDGLVFATARGESHGSEALAAGVRDFEAPAFDHNFGPAHQLLGDRQKNCSVQHAGLRHPNLSECMEDDTCAKPQLFWLFLLKE
jgi:hypothetical protein